MRYLSPESEADYWLGEPIYEENQSVGFHRMWYLDVLSQLTDFQVGMESIEGYFTKREIWSRFDHDKKLHAYILHRTLLDNEIVFDFDAPTYEKNVSNFKKLYYDFLEEKGFVPYIWFSGNKGLHIHFFLNYKPLAEKLEMSDQELIVRKMRTKKLFFKRLTSFIAKKLEWFYTSFAIDGQINHTNHLIRAEGSLNKKGFKTFLGNTPRDIPPTPPIVDPEQKEYPRFPFHHYCYTESEIKYSTPTDLIKITKEFIIDKKLRNEVNQIKLSNFFDKPVVSKKDHPCIKFFLSEEFGNLKECRKRALFIIASHYNNQPDQIKLVRDWNQNILGGYLRDEIILTSCRSTKGTVGCNYVKELLGSLGQNKVCEGCTKSKLLRRS